jgi:hypothetical protein
VSGANKQLFFYLKEKNEEKIEGRERNLLN